MRSIINALRCSSSKRSAGLVVLALLILPVFAVAQDTLPKFSVKNVGSNRIIIGWTNTFEDIRQISIQRSKDSLTGYKTLLTVPDPTTPQNGYVDTKAPTDRMFYRLYIMLDKGVFLFSDPLRPVKDTTLTVTTETTIGNDTVMIGDSFVVAKPFGVRIEKLHGQDSVAAPQVNNNKPKPNAFTPSLYVYTHRDGNLRVKLPEADEPKKYSIKFFEEDGTFLFELKDIKEKTFRVDKASFFHAGWFRFELLDDGKLVEKHKFYIEKDF
jgi:hypothetical protein